jgi:hypothetical protein
MLPTPSSGVVRMAPEPVQQSCPECGKPTPNCGIWNQPDYRCRNPLCARFPFKPAQAARLEH